MVSLCCDDDDDDDDDDCVITDNDITGGKWVIGPDPATDAGGFSTGGVVTGEPAGDLLPHQVRSWQYWSGGWLSDPELTVIVTGNININILCLEIIIDQYRTDLHHHHFNWPSS